jgi:hypothetical protein
MFEKNLDYGVSEHVAEEGSNLMTALFDASVQNSMGGIGGCKTFNINEFPERWHKLITAYLNHEICAVTACYIAMRDIEKGGCHA